MHPTAGLLIPLLLSAAWVPHTAADATPDPAATADQLQQGVLTKHNALRAWHSSPPLAWDPQLAASAAAFVAQCQFRMEAGLTVGQNLGVSSARDPTGLMEAMTQMWWVQGLSYSSQLGYIRRTCRRPHPPTHPTHPCLLTLAAPAARRPHLSAHPPNRICTPLSCVRIPHRYDSGKSYDWAHPGFQMSAGQFTQLVWRETTGLGCAAQYCANIAGFGPGTLVSCRCVGSRDGWSG